MNAEQKQRALQMLRRFEQAAPMSLQVDNAAVDMAALLHELIDAPEPEQPNQSEQHLEMVNAPAPSVPDEQLQAAFDRGLKAGNEQAIAQQIEIHKLHDLLAVQQPEQPADLVRDAARYRWLRNWTRGAYGIDSNPAFILPHVPTMLDQNIMSGSVAQHLDNAIDAAIAAEKGGEGE